MTWRPVTVPAAAPDPRGDLLPFDLTAAEQSHAAVIRCQIEAQRRRQNERDALRPPKKGTE